MAERLDVLAALSRSYLFEDLTVDELRPLADVAVIRRLVRGESLCRVNDPADELFIVVGGELKASVVNLDGEEVVHQIYGAGMTTGEPGYFSIDRIRIVNVLAVEPSVVILVHRRDLTPFSQRHVEVKDRALEGLASASRWQTSLISTLATRPLVDRLILRLLELADSNGDQVTGEAVRTPKISQTTLAAMIGVSRENVNRALGTLAARGSIRRESGYYILVDEAGLRREATRDWHMGSRRDRRVEPGSQ